MELIVTVDRAPDDDPAASPLGEWPAQPCDATIRLKAPMNRK